MNAIQTLEQRLRMRFPTAILALDPAERPTSPWFLDVKLDGHPVIIEWRPRHGFGITAKREPGFGEGADELVRNSGAVYRRVVALLLAKGKTTLPQPVRLRELRSRRGLSQVQLAERLSVNQAAISKLEQREDVLVGTLRDLVHALGGKLVVRAEFPDSGCELEFGNRTRTPLRSRARRGTRTKTRPGPMGRRARANRGG